MSIQRLALESVSISTVFQCQNTIQGGKLIYKTKDINLVCLLLSISMGERQGVQKFKIYTYLRLSPLEYFKKYIVFSQLLNVQFLFTSPTGFTTQDGSTHCHCLPLFTYFIQQKIAPSSSKCFFQSTKIYMIIFLMISYDSQQKVRSNSIFSVISLISTVSH